MPSYEMNLYSHPEKSGLEIFAELEYSSGSYEFDTRVVWKRLSDGKLLTERDAGCSCPMPFEYLELSDLKEVESTGWLKEEIADEIKKGYGNSRLAEESASFIEKIEKTLK